MKKYIYLLVSVLMLGFIIGCSDDGALIKAEFPADANGVTFTLFGFNQIDIDEDEDELFKAALSGNPSTNVVLTSTSALFSTLNDVVGSTTVTVSVCGVDAQKTLSATTTDNGVVVVKFTKSDADETDSTYSLQFNSETTRNYWSTANIGLILATCPTPAASSASSD